MDHQGGSARHGYNAEARQGRGHVFNGIAKGADGLNHFRYAFVANQDLVLTSLLHHLDRQGKDQKEEERRPKGSGVSSG